MAIEIESVHRRAYLRNCRLLALVAAVFAALYLRWLIFDARPHTYPLYLLLVGAELFNITQAAGFWATISKQKWRDYPPASLSSNAPWVDVFVTVNGEPPELVERTISAAHNLVYPNFRVWVLDDGHDPKVQAIALRYGAQYLTRMSKLGAKAGNLNNALQYAKAPFVAIFDADQMPHRDFLVQTLGGFGDSKVALVQTPQVYANWRTNRVADGANDQQALFYGPVLRGREGFRAVFGCGTNMVLRRSVIDEVGGIPEDSITEDLRYSLLLLNHGYSATYIPKILAEGLGPLDVGSYLKQQFRWCRGGLQIMLRHPSLAKNLTMGQRLEFTTGFLYWFTGWAYLAYVILPIVFLTTGLRPIQTPNGYMPHFLPYIATTMATLIYASDFTLSIGTLWFTISTFPVHVKAFLTTLFNTPARFVVTSKEGGKGSLRPVLPHLALATVLAASAVYGLRTFGPERSVVVNAEWVALHLVILLSFVWLAARPRRATKGAHAPHRVLGTSRLAWNAVTVAVVVGVTAYALAMGRGPNSLGGTLAELTAPPPLSMPIAAKVDPSPQGAYLGIFDPPAPFNPAPIDRYTRLAGKPVAIVLWFQAWGPDGAHRFDPAACWSVLKRGAVPMITWEPWNPSPNANVLVHPQLQPPYELHRIIRGDFDTYIRSWAKQIHEFGGPIMLRPMHEMNGRWYPWCGTVNGNTPAEYIAAWRHIHDIFDAEGATNVTWVWSINRNSIPKTPENTYAAYYPGDAYVDWTGISGFNRGSAFKSSYRKSIAYLKKVGKPICIAETGSTETFGNKPAWILQTYRDIRANKSLRGVIYYDYKEFRGKKGSFDWRINTSPASLLAYQQAIANPRYDGSPPESVAAWLRSLTPADWQRLNSLKPIY